MQVLPGIEGLDERLITGQVRHEAHLDLRVVGAHERLESLTSDEGAANSHTVGTARGDVLQVRIGRREATRGRSNLGEGRVDASVGGDGRGQGVDHLLELDAVAMGEQESEEVVPRSPLVCGLRVQVRQGLSIRRVPGLRLLRLRQAEVIEEQLLELLGARQVDLASRRSPCSLARGIDSLAELVGQPFKHGRVSGDTDVFHLAEEDRQRHLHVGEQRGLGAFLQAGTQSRGERVQVGGQLAGPHLSGARASSHVTEIEESLRVALLFLDDNTENAREHILQLVGALIGMREVRRQHRVELDATESPAARRERMTRTLRVVHDQGRGRGEDLGERFLLCGTQFDGVDHECFVVRGKNKAGDIATSRPHVALNEHGERRVGVSPLGNVAGSIREGH